MSQSFHSSILDAICNMQDELISVWDSQSGELIFANQEYQTFIKKGAIPANFKPALAHLFPNAQLDADLILQALITKGQWSQDLELKHWNDRIDLTKVRLHTFESEGRLLVLQRVINVEELHSAVQIIRQEKQRFEALFEYATMAIVVANTSGDIVMANHFAKDLFGYADEIFDLKVEDLIPRRFREKHVGYRDKYNSHPQNRPMGQGMQLYAINRVGHEFPVEVSLGHYQINGDRFSIAFIIDITRRKAIEETLVQQTKLLEQNNLEIEQLNDELEAKVVTRTKELEDTLTQLSDSKKELEAALDKEKELSDLKTRFVSMASHEFRTPLSTILSSASLVAKYTLSEEQDKRDKHVQRIRSAVNNLTDILNEFLSIGRIEEGRIHASFSSFNIKEQLALICNEMIPILKQGQQFDYQHEGELSVHLDLSLLRNVMINLISNAIKFSPLSSVITLRSKVINKQILISIADQGIGIPEEDQKHLFERFFRANNVTNIQGTGLGLHIVSKYVELMHGQISFTSELEKGTTFNVHFNYEQDSIDRRQP